MKKAYETPEVTKVEFDARDRITASACDIQKEERYDASCPDMYL